MFVLGFPSSLGLKDINYSRPLLRKGIVAGKDPQTRIIIIDCPTYPGNSGGPALQHERTHLLDVGRLEVFGLVSKLVLFEQKWVNLSFGRVNTEVSNSGYTIVVPGDAILELLPMAAEDAKPESGQKPEESDKTPADGDAPVKPPPAEKFQGEAEE